MISTGFSKTMKDYYFSANITITQLHTHIIGYKQSNVNAALVQKNSPLTFKNC